MVVPGQGSGAAFAAEGISINGEFSIAWFEFGKKERYSVFLGHKLSLPASGGVGKENLLLR